MENVILSRSKNQEDIFAVIILACFQGHRVEYVDEMTSKLSAVLFPKQSHFLHLSIDGKEIFFLPGLQ